MKTLAKLLVTSTIMLCLLVAIALYLKSLVVPSFPLHDAVRENDVEKVRELIAQGYDVNGLTKLPIWEFDLSHGGPLHNVTPLHVATEIEIGIGDPNGPLKIVRMLLEEGADVNARDSARTTPIYAATKKALSEHHAYDLTLNARREVLRLFLLKRPNMRGADRVFTPSVLGYAVLNSYDETFLDLALQCNFDDLRIITGIQGVISAMTPDPRNKSVVDFDPREVLELILKHKTAPLYLSAALAWAVRCDESELAEELFNRGADPNLKAPGMLSPIEYAETSGNEDLLELLRSRSE
jgi:ankyrin repeat protein